MASHKLAAVWFREQKYHLIPRPHQLMNYKEWEQSSLISSTLHSWSLLSVLWFLSWTSDRGWGSAAVTNCQNVQFLIFVFPFSLGQKWTSWDPHVSFSQLDSWSPSPHKNLHITTSVGSTCLEWLILTWVEILNWMIALMLTWNCAFLFQSFERSFISTTGHMTNTLSVYVTIIYILIIWSKLYWPSHLCKFKSFHNRTTLRNTCSTSEIFWSHFTIFLFLIEMQ